MIGTGVFTTTGFLVRDVGGGRAVLVLWGLGGLVSLCGALCYAELAAAFPRNGGDYHLLSRIFHPALGFVAGWVSLVVGFAAPVAASALAFGEYLQPVFPGVSSTGAGLALVLALTALHARDVKQAAATQNAATIPKIIAIVVLAIALLAAGEPARLWEGGAQVTSAISTVPAAAGLLFIFYAYSGWNGAVYVAGEVVQPRKNLPRALITGTVFTTVVYVLLNAGFLAAAPPEALAGTVQVAAVAAAHVFGKAAGVVVSGLIALGLVSAVGAMIMAGPRIYAVMGEDYRALSFLSRRNARGAPSHAVVLQGLLSVGMMLVMDIEAIFTYVGMCLSLMSAATVAGLMWLRYKEPELERAYRTPLYPLTPVVFLALMGWSIAFSVMGASASVGWSAATLASGFLLYRLVRSSAETAGLQR